jgi:hypothetical protein
VSIRGEPLLYFCYLTYDTYYWLLKYVVERGWRQGEGAFLRE